jgi:hypothetical protein
VSRYSAITILPLALFASSAVGQDGWIKKNKDVQFYLKTRNNLVSTWDQEIGLQATVYRKSKFSLQLNTAYDPVYPISFNKKPRFTVGTSFGYTILDKPYRVTIYDKPKYDYVRTWKNETGIAVRLYNSPAMSVTANLAYVSTSPYYAKGKPGYLGLINLAFPLGR